MKAILCDSSSLISIGDSCLLKVFGYLKKILKINFLIPEEVKEEIVDHPLSMPSKRYSWSAFALYRNILRGDIDVIKVRTEQERVKEIMDLANRIFFVRGKPLKLVHYGEAGILAIAESVGVNYILIDERTTRLMIESPYRLKEHLEWEFNANVMVSKRHLEEFQERFKRIKIIRSSEILYLAYKHGFFERFPNSRESFIAALYNLKYSGCSISFEELREYEKIVGR